jgi:phosphoketolase
MRTYSRAARPAPLSLTRFRDYAVAAATPCEVEAESTRVLGAYLRDVMKPNREKRRRQSIAAPMFVCKTATASH